MHPTEFWTTSADALEMSIEGNRLIAQQIADFAGSCWHQVTRSWHSLIHGHGHHRHLPPA